MLAELRTISGRPVEGHPAAVPAWPLEGVLRLHQDLRRGEDAQPSAPDEHAGNGNVLEHAPKPVLQLAESSSALNDRVDLLERALTMGQDELRQAAQRGAGLSRGWLAALVVLAIAAVVGSAIAFRLQRQVETGLNEAAARVAAARQDADAAKQLVTTVRADAEQRIAEARQTASKAETITNVLAAPDLVRYNLVARDPAARMRGQVLWSRSRGLVFSATQLPPAPPATTYQLWVLTADQSVSVGVFAPESGGGVTLTKTDIPRVPQRVVGFTVTVEPKTGSSAPSETIVLARAAPVDPS